MYLSIHLSIYTPTRSYAQPPNTHTCARTCMQIDTNSQAYTLTHCIRTSSHCIFLIRSNQSNKRNGRTTWHGRAVMACSPGTDPPTFEGVHDRHPFGHQCDAVCRLCWQVISDLKMLSMKESPENVRFATGNASSEE